MLHQKEAHGSITWLDAKDNLEALASLVEMELFETAEDLCDWGSGKWGRDRIYVLYLRELAKRANAAYQAKIKAIVEEFPQAEYHEGPLKGEPRMLVKGREDYAQDAKRCYGEEDLGVGGVVDIARMSICCEHAEEMCRVVDRISRLSFDADGLEVLRQKNGFHPEAESSGGYRDFKLTILTGVPGMEAEGVRHVVECQLLLKPYLQLKKFQHVLYEVERGDCFDLHGRLGVGVFRALEANHRADGLMTLVTAVNSSYKKTYAKYKKETDAKIAEAARDHSTGQRIMELLEMQKQKEKLVPLEAEQEEAQGATEVFIMECLKARDTSLPPFEFDDWLAHVKTEVALAEIESIVCGRTEPWQEKKEVEEALFSETCAVGWNRTHNASKPRRRPTMNFLTT
jgi:hypothetical protein